MDRTRNARQALAMNRMVRSLSAANKNTTVHWEFFNQVYDALVGLVDEELVWEIRYNRLMEWAKEASSACMDEELSAKLEVLRREVEGDA